LLHKWKCDDPASIHCPLCFLIGGGFLPAAFADTRLALLIGNQSYNAKVGTLKNPHKDVVLIEAALKRLGFQVTVVKDADYRAMDVSVRVEDCCHESYQNAPTDGLPWTAGKCESRVLRGGS